MRDVTHWSDEDGEREKKAAEPDVEPRYFLDSEFSQLLNFFEFGDFDARRKAHQPREWTQQDRQHAMLRRRGVETYYHTINERCARLFSCPEADGVQIEC